jgi:DNA polymerase III sliding clamp (beta) subunit (PCNA family)
VATLTIKTKLLKQILEALTPAAASCLDESPTSFMETIHITWDEDDKTVAFVTTDGFRSHIAQIKRSAVDAYDEGEIVIGADFLAHSILLDNADDDSDESIVITATNSHTKWTVETSDPSDGVAETDIFTIPNWPDMHRLISDEVVADEEVGFNLDYFHDAFDAFDSWHDPVDEDGAMVPLRVHALQRKRVNHFSMKNEAGTLRVLLMPIILKDSEWR